ncbi:hypothetical protein VTJ83DRAFT_7285 [Remersonia thermophila]|uniref:Alpha/beta hydrolase fold-3 domain-containing protein n=1 Tax=Remersonia thermophila TaxID=72144 RepID=A0ABR4D324_9PEZI
MRYVSRRNSRRARGDVSAMHTTGVSLAVTPAVVSTFFSHYLNRKRLAHKPTAHLPYHQGIAVVRAFLDYAAHRTVEDIQAFTSPWVPHPQWVKVDKVEIPEAELSRAADLLVNHLGPDGIRRVGGKEWWRWRKPKSPLRAEWIEMKADYEERQRNPEAGNRVMLYVHGGAYYMCSVDEHRYQIQRHARKLKARVLAPRYRLAPQFPFPCGLQDCLATYLHLISQQDPSTVVLAGDSAGGGMILAMLVILRDSGIPLPAGAALISPWCDLTHSFPSLAGDASLDYIPPSGFHHKPSMAWPPPNQEEMEELKRVAMEQRGIKTSDSEPSVGTAIPASGEAARTTPRLVFTIDGEQVELKEQIQLYTTNDLMIHPLVSPVLQPTLGGLPPLLIMVGGGELLRDEQIYLAHKCAHPSAYLPPEEFLDERARELIKKYKPTDVQLQVWDDMCHVGPTLAFTRPAKYMYRSIAQFAAWALARAQKTPVDVRNDSNISVVSDTSSTSDNENPTQPRSAAPSPSQPPPPPSTSANSTYTSVGHAGDPLPPFESHMIRQRVTRHGEILPLPPPSELPGCCMPREQVGVTKVETARKWLEQRRRLDERYRKVRARVHATRLREAAEGALFDGGFGEGEVPPPSALARRRWVIEEEVAGKEKKKKKEKGLGLSWWSSWGSKHDQVVMRREERAGLHRTPTQVVQGGDEQGQGARGFEELKEQAREVREARGGGSEASERATAAHENEAGTEGDDEQEGVQASAVSSGRSTAEGEDPKGLAEKPSDPAATAAATTTTIAGQSAVHSAPEEVSKDGKGHDDDDLTVTGVTGKRVMIGGVATPFSLRKEPDTASMITLESGGTAVEDGERPAADTPSPGADKEKVTGADETAPLGSKL